LGYQQHKTCENAEAGGCCAGSLLGDNSAVDPNNLCVNCALVGGKNKKSWTF
jgi:hypothetical protein